MGTTERNSILSPLTNFGCECTFYKDSLFPKEMSMNYCSQCGGKIQEGMKFCPSCGQKLSDVPPVLEQEKNRGTRSSTVTIETADPTYYSDNKGVRVTASRLIIRSKVYSMANIASIKTGEKSLWRLIGVLAAFGGAAVLFVTQADDAGLFVGLPLIGLGLVLILFRNYSLTIVSAAGEDEALESPSKKYITGIANAINEALIKRG